ncbi:hypothetical protein GobsT_25640 [Gemmata obscuriglobus]|uniref:hypothetical protein n=1 Tax=Gemmata obscuriglobus TaxID=114 RepID=UPI00016C49BC|nr:hypothetical protein [Gemmata obscuriglobus]QEG27800.1 hypothetical protein GobsT_25640 [Gemmata obscuriglobus]VTS05126.1 unnamed protein product [Gemmata obscuriglobus UQM 2246]
MGTERNDFVSASEIASWAWCPESWRLETLGDEPGNQSAIASGRALHADRSAFEVTSRRAAARAVWLLAIALIVAALFYLVLGGAG